MILGGTTGTGSIWVDVALISSLGADCCLLHADSCSCCRACWERVVQCGGPGGRLLQMWHFKTMAGSAGVSGQSVPRCYGWQSHHSRTTDEGAKATADYNGTQQMGQWGVGVMLGGTSRGGAHYPLNMMLYSTQVKKRVGLKDYSYKNLHKHMFTVLFWRLVLQGKKRGFGFKCVYLIH